MADEINRITGHCNLSKHQQILETFKASDLQEDNQLAQDKLRTEICQIVGDTQDLEVRVYLTKFQDPITVLNGNGQNKLAIWFKEGGEIKYEWIAKSLKEITKTFVSNLAKQITGATLEALVNIKSEIQNKVLIAAGINELAWKQ